MDNIGKDMPDAFDKIIETHPLSCEFETDARDIWPKRWHKLKESYNKLKASRDKAINSRNTFAFLLGRYGRHDKSCPLNGKYIGGKECTCGYLKALKEAGEL